MKKVLSLFMLFLLVLFFVACSASEAESFSWSDVQSEFSAEDAGIVRDGFVNVTKTWVNSADDAFRLAEKEHRLQPGESYSVSYDSTADMWRVSFFSMDEDVVGGCVDVYLSGDGLTELIVAGE